MRQLHRLRRSDEGMTLVELMVVMIVSSIIAVLTVTLVIGVMRTNSRNVVRQDQVDAARVAVESMGKTLRASVKPSQLSSGCGSGCTEDAFLTGTKLGVQFYSNIDNPGNITGPSRVTYSVVTTGAQKGNLVETIQIPNSNVPGSSGYAYCSGTAGSCKSRITTRVLARDVVHDGPAVLRYFDDAGNEMVPVGTGSLTTAQLKSVLSIEVRLAVMDRDSDKPKPTTYIQRLMLPNAQAVIKAGDD